MVLNQRNLYSQRGTFGKVWKYFWLSQLGVGACSWHLGIMEPGMMLNSPHCTGQNPATKKYPAPNVSSDEVVKLCYRTGFYPYHPFPSFSHPSCLLFLEPFSRFSLFLFLSSHSKFRLVCLNFKMQKKNHMRVC